MEARSRSGLRALLAWITIGKHRIISRSGRELTLEMAPMEDDHAEPQILFKVPAAALDVLLASGGKITFTTQTKDGNSLTFKT
jgi:hypothetical protein